MDNTPTLEQLVAFELEIADLFNAGKIRAPVHLSGGNEKQLIEIFKDIRPQDWVCSTWRNHYHGLLKGVPPDIMRGHILEGYSIALNYPDYRFYSSAIVGGMLPIAVGIAWAIKRADVDERVWMFVGDMASRSGIFHECYTYAQGHNLPVDFVVEENGLSVCTNTDEVWGGHWDWDWDSSRYHRYQYRLPFPHSGAGKRVEF